MRSGLNKFFVSASPSLFIVLNIFLFGPYTIFQGNLEEFSIPLLSILKFLLLPALSLFALLSLIGLLLPEKARRVYVSIIFVLGVLLWLQGNFLVWKYGLLNGHAFDWSINAWRGWVDGAVWVGLLIAACLFFRKIYKASTVASIALTGVLLASLLFTTLQKPGTWTAHQKSSQQLQPAKEIFAFSSQLNIIQFILDGFQSDIFEEIVKEDFGRYSTALEGFTFFREAMGSFPTTYMSVPAFLSRYIYKNNMPMRQFVLRVNRRKTIFNLLYDSGMETDLVCSGLFRAGARYTNSYNIAVPYGEGIREKLKFESSLMIDLVLFRHAPHYLKRFIYNNELWLVQRLFGEKDKRLQIRYFSHQAFLEDLVEHLSVTRNAPVYKYIHLMTTHFPIVVNKDCEYSGEIPATPENTKIQAKCGLDNFITFLDKLREQGIYDSSLIILHADHGHGQAIPMTNGDRPSDENRSPDGRGLAEIAGSALPLLAVKPPYGKGNLETSRAQVSLTDIPATISSFVGFDKEFDGRPVFDVDPDEVRERWFYFYEWRHEHWQSTYLPRLDEYMVKGSVFDRNSWHLTNTFYPPGQTK